MKVLACFEFHPIRNSALIFQIYNYYSAQLGYNILKLHMRRKWLYVSQSAKKLKERENCGQ